MQTTRFGLKSLPTYYKGITFRSRLEARWAIVLDELGIQWEYETEAFEIGASHFNDPYNPDVFAYLPDFYLPQYDSFLEVKGKLDETEYWRLLRIVWSITQTASWWPTNTQSGKPFFLAGNLGIKGQKTKMVSLFNYKGWIEADFQKTDFDQPFKSRNAFIGIDFYDPEFRPCSGRFSDMTIEQVCYHLCNNFEHDAYDKQFERAIDRARSARFDRGHYA